MTATTFSAQGASVENLEVLGPVGLELKSLPEPLPRGLGDAVLQRETAATPRRAAVFGFGGRWLAGATRPPSPPGPCAVDPNAPRSRRAVTPPWRKRSHHWHAVCPLTPRAAATTGVPRFWAHGKTILARSVLPAGRLRERARALSAAWSSWLRISSLDRAASAHPATLAKTKTYSNYFSDTTLVPPGRRSTPRTW